MSDLDPFAVSFSAQTDWLVPLRDQLSEWLVNPDAADPSFRNVPVPLVLPVLVAANVNDETVDNLPGPVTLCRLGLQLDPDASVGGTLVMPPRPDARVHLDTLVVTAREDRVRELIGVLSPDDLSWCDECGSWHAWWD